MSSNFKDHLVNLSFLVAVIAHPCTTSAQAPISSVGSMISTKDHMIQLERISNAHAQLLTQFYKQLSENQNDIDSLRGQIQEIQYQLDEVVKQQKEILLQMDKIHNSDITRFSRTD